MSGWGNYPKSYETSSFRTYETNPAFFHIGKIQDSGLGINGLILIEITAIMHCIMIVSWCFRKEHYSIPTRQNKSVGFRNTKKHLRYSVFRVQSHSVLHRKVQEYDISLEQENRRGIETLR